MLDNSHDPTIDSVPMNEDWPSLDEFNSLDRTHGRKFDFDYEPIRKESAGEAGTVDKGIFPKEH